MLDTGATTQLVIDTIGTISDLFVGDGIAPAEGGWSLGQPNTGEFVPYAVVAFMGARPRTPELTMVKQEAAWLASFQLRYHGGSRAQVDWTGNACRRAVDSLLKATVITDVFYEIAWVEWQSLGGVMRNDSVDPPIWNATDSLTLHAVKRGT
jgi:hypothetical protein